MPSSALEHDLSSYWPFLLGVHPLYQSYGEIPHFEGASAANGWNSVEDLPPKNNLTALKQLQRVLRWGMPKK